MRLRGAVGPVECATSMLRAFSELLGRGRGKVLVCTDAAKSFDGPFSITLEQWKLPANCLIQIDGAKVAAKKPAAAITAAALWQITTPYLSIIRPKARLPKAKPIIVMVKGSDAPPRPTPYSVCIAGMTMTMAQMPTVPIEAMITEIARRNHE